MGSIKGGGERRKGWPQNASILDNARDNKKGAIWATSEQ